MKIFLIAFSFISLASFGQTVATDTTAYKPAVFFNGRLYKLSYWPSGVSGVTTMAAVGSTPNANGASISGSTLTLQPASATQPGVVSTAAQSFAGQKLFGSGIQIQGGITSPAGAGLLIPASALFDLGDDTHFGTWNAGGQDPVYYDADEIHWTDEGHRYVGEDLLYDLIISLATGALP